MIRSTTSVLINEEIVPLVSREQKLSLDNSAVIEAKEALLRWQPRYAFSHHLPVLGRGGSKSYFVVKNSGENRIMSISSYKKTLSAVRNQEEGKHLIQLLKSIDHVNIVPLLDCDYNVVKNRMVCIRKYYPFGSLYDFCKGVNPIRDLSVKAETEGHVLIEQVIRRFGLQILNGITALFSMGIRYPQLSAHNIMVEKVNGEFVVKLSELENSFIGAQNHYQQLYNNNTTKNVQRDEILAFGKILYFMATKDHSNDFFAANNWEVFKKDSSKRFFLEIESEQLRAILNQIFITRKITSLKALAKDPYFCGLEKSLVLESNSIKIDRPSQLILSEAFGRIEKAINMQSQ